VVDQMPAHRVLHGGRDQKYCWRRRSSAEVEVVVRVEHAGDVLGHRLVLDGGDVVALVEVVEVEVVGGAGAPQAQGVDGVVAEARMGVS